MCPNCLHAHHPPGSSLRAPCYETCKPCYQAHCEGIDRVMLKLNIEYAQRLPVGSYARIEAEGYLNTKWLVEKVEDGQVWLEGWGGPLPAFCVYPIGG